MGVYLNTSTHYSLPLDLGTWRSTHACWKEVDATLWVEPPIKIRSLSLDLRIRIYKTLIYTTRRSIYGCQTWSIKVKESTEQDFRTRKRY